jgi:diguanylate cyclase (GGDEF)-like protein
MYTKPIIRYAIFLLVLLLVAFIVFASFLVRGQFLSTLAATKQQQDHKAVRVAARLEEKLHQAQERVRILALNPLIEHENPRIIEDLLVKTLAGCPSCEALLVTDYSGSLIAETPTGTHYPYFTGNLLASLPSKCEVLYINAAGQEDHYAFACAAQMQHPEGKGRLIVALLNLNYVAKATLLGNKDDEVTLLADELAIDNNAILLFAPEQNDEPPSTPIIVAAFGPIIKEKAAPYLEGTASVPKLTWTITVTKPFKSFIAQEIKTTFSGIQFTVSLFFPILIILALTIIATNHSRRYFRELALRDGLTGLYNHRFFQTELRAVIDGRNGRKVSLLLLDVDDFKSINDAHGHQVGDKILAKLATILSQNIRNTDIAARYGGEEFAVILIGIGLEEAFKIAERIRIAIKQQCACTVSIGISSFPACATTSEGLIKTADDALYKAKSLSKDRVQEAQPRAVSCDHNRDKDKSLYLQ